MARNEAQTRQQFIDKHLRLAGWNVDDPSVVSQELDIDLNLAGVPRVLEPTSKYSNHQFADYVLIQKNYPIAVVEAKKTSENAQKGQEQALQYALNLQRINKGNIPFIFYSNGHDTYFWEYDFYPPEKVYGYPTKDDLEWMWQKRETRKPLSVELINNNIAGRDYQIEGIRKVLEGIEEKKRKFLLVMATGTGKTRTAAALFDVLIRARWAKRILFLVDRVELRKQALDAFKEHIPSEPVYPKDGDTEFPKDRRIYVETYQTMISYINLEEISQRNYISPFFFDVIIADESHRSIYNAYKQIIDYFHAIKIGLTATPTSRIQHDTFNMFNCVQGLPTYAYTYDQALSHNPPYLCDFEVLNIRSKFQIKGIHGKELSEEEQESLIDQGIDPENINFDGTDLEKKVTNSGTNEVIVREFMEESIKDPSGAIPGKSIFFCVSKEHARRIEKIFNNLYPEYAGKLARVIVSGDPYVNGEGGLLEQFKKQNFPRVAISVDMLDTGIDVREIVNLVFAKPVFSFVKFWQMIGRGTRVLEVDYAKRKAWCADKEGFLIIDCWDNFERFKLNPRGREPSEQTSLAVRLFNARLLELDAASRSGDLSAVDFVKNSLKNDISLLPKANIVVKDAAKELEAIENQEFWKRCSTKDIDFLRIHIAPLMRARSSEDFKALQFELQIVKLRTAILQKNTIAIDSLSAEIVQQVSELPRSVNIVNEKSEIIDEVLSRNDWQDVPLERLSQISSSIAPLMRYREGSTSMILQLNLADLTAKKEYVEFGPHHERMSTALYREKVEELIHNLENTNPILQKIKSGNSVSDEEIAQLAKLLEEQKLYITENLLKKVYDHKSASFVQFIKHILGLEKLLSWEEEVESRFDKFIAKHNTFNSMQIQFLLTLKTFVLQNRKIERKNLIDSPFTQIHPQGIRGVFVPEQIEEVLAFAEKLAA